MGSRSWRARSRTRRSTRSRERSPVFRLRRAAALLLVLLAQAACAGGSGPSSAPPPPVRPPTATAAPEGALGLVVAEDDAPPELVRPFERDTGCKVSVLAVDSGAAVLNRAEDAPTGTDLYAAPSDVASRLIAQGLVQPLDSSRLPGYAELAPQLQAPAFSTVRSRRYGVAYVWGPNVLIYARRRFPVAPSSFAALYDPALRGHITVPDSPLQIADAALLQGAADPYALTPEELRSAMALLRKQRPLIREYWSAPADLAPLFASGAVVLAQGRMQVAASLERAGADVAAAVPDGPVTAWATTWLEARQAPHPVCAYRWLAYVSSAAVQRRAAERLEAVPANLHACALVGAERCAALRLDDAAFRAAMRFARTPDGATDLDAWRGAWAAVKG